MPRQDSVDRLFELAAILAAGYERLVAASSPAETPNHDKPINSNDLRRNSLDTSCPQSDRSCVPETATCSGERR